MGRGTVQSAALHISVLLLMALLISGCSPRSRFASKVSDADRVVLMVFGVTNVAARSGLTSAEAGEIAAAIRNGKIFGDTGPAQGAVKIEFLHGTKSLANLIVNEDLFWLDDFVFHDSTGAIRNLWSKLNLAKGTNGVAPETLPLPHHGTNL